MTDMMKVVEKPGWDSGARGIASFPLDGSIEFAVGQRLGIVCGLTTASNGVSYTEIEYAFGISEWVARIYERGSLKHAVSPVSQDAIYRITRLNGVVRYTIDDVLHYTSTVPSTGAAFADCSLYWYGDEILGLTTTDLGGSRVDAGFPALVASGAEEDVDTVFAELPDFAASGEDGFEEYVAALLPPLVSSGAEEESDTGFAELPPLQGVGAEANRGIAVLPPLAGFGNEEWFIPSVNAGFATFPPLVGYGWETGLGGTEGFALFPPLVASGSEEEIDVGFGWLPPLSLVEVVEQPQAVGILIAPPWVIEIRQWAAADAAMAGALRLPLLRGTGALNAAPSLSGQLALPTPRLSAQFGAQLSGTLPLPGLDARLLDDAALAGRLALPVPSLSAALHVVESMRCTGFLPLPRLAGGSGLALWGSLPLPQGSGRLDEVRHLSGTLLLPLPQLAGRATRFESLSGALWLSLPRLHVEAASSGALTLPLPRLSSNATADADRLAAQQKEEVWLVNLRTGAVTKARWGAFERMVHAHGILYGLRGGVLYSIAQDAPADMTLRFAPQMFGTGLVKRCEAVYALCRESHGLHLTLIDDELRAWPYATPTDTAPAYGTHKIAVGKGIHFHTMGLVIRNHGGGALDIGGMEIIIIPLSRRPR